MPMKMEDPQSFEVQSIDDTSEFEDPTEYWRIAQHLGDTIKIKNETYKHHFDNIQNQYIMKVSDSSCKVEDVNGIIFGGISSRFWLYRKHIISQDFQQNLYVDTTERQVTKNYKGQKQVKMPFYSWECITLELNNGRTMDLVIHDENDMMKFIKYLIFKLETINNTVQTGSKLKEVLVKQGLKYNEKELTEQQIKADCQYKIIRKTYLKYLLLRIRAKISYMAFSKRQTVVELIVT